MRLDLSQVSLVCVDNIYPDLAYRAIKCSSSDINYYQRIFFTSSAWIFKNKKNIDQNILLVEIDHVDSINKYSDFVLKHLTQYIESDYILIIQWDGYVYSKLLWREQFLSYDYIGANWNKSDVRTVGNGGFSLRSKRLLNAYQSSNLQAGHPEDEVICINHRKILEDQYGCKFADPKVADLFSFEEYRELAGDTFGFHGFFNIPLIGKFDDIRAFIDLMPNSLFSHGHFEYFVKNIIHYQVDGRQLIDLLYLKIQSNGKTCEKTKKVIFKAFYKNGLDTLALQYLKYILTHEKLFSLVTVMYIKLIIFRLKMKFNLGK